MEKAKNIIFTTLMLVLIGVVVFLAIQVSSLKFELLAYKNQLQDRTLDKDELTKELRLFKKDYNKQMAKLKKQKEEFAKTSNYFDKLTKKLSYSLRSEFLRKPQFAIRENVFSKKQETKSNIELTGDPEALNAWIINNEMFLDHILKRSLVLKYDSARRDVVVEEIIPGSVFYQMGLRVGDHIRNIDGRAMNQGDSLRARLLEARKTRIRLTRNNNPLAIQIDYRLQPRTQEVSLNLSEEDLETYLGHFKKSMIVAQAIINGQNAGLKLLKIDSNNLFNKLKLQPLDVITKINNQDVSEENLVSLIKKSKGKLTVDYIRRNKELATSVLLSE